MPGWYLPTRRRPAQRCPRTCCRARNWRSLNSGGAPAEAEKQLSGLQPEERGHLLAAGLVLLEDEAPAEWRQQAKALLFAPERPYFL